MKKTIIHIGLHKTASSFFQENIWPNVQDYTYLNRTYIQHNHAFNQLQYADDSLYKKDLVIKELDKIGSDRLLISDESLSGKPIYFSYLNRTLIAKRLKQIFPDAIIILFLRDQKDIILSHYSSYIKMPFGTKKLENFFYKPHRDWSYQDYLDSPGRFDLSTLYYNSNDYFIHLDCFLYSHLIDLYLNLFENCHVFLYEELKNDRDMVLEKIENILGEHIHSISPQKKNVSLSYSDLEKNRVMNRVLLPVPNRHIRKIFKVGMKIAPPLASQDLKANVSRFVGNYYSDDNKILKERLTSLNWHRVSDKYV